MNVYFDHNATAPVPRELENELSGLLSKGFANPGSQHADGRAARRLITRATEQLALACGADPSFIFWTSGATESNAWVIHSVCERAREAGKTPKLLVSAVEHESVRLSAKWAESHGAVVKTLPVLPNGALDLDALAAVLKEDGQWSLLSIMHANNETGVVQPVAKAAELAKSHGIPVHVDCVQTLGKLPIDMLKLGATFATFSAHKLGGLKGVGALAVNGQGRILAPLLHGKQQKTLRGGTENPVGVAFFGMILDRMAKGQLLFPKELQGWKESFESELMRQIPGTRIHGFGAERLFNTTYVGFDGIDGDSILMGLDLEGISASSGSACTSGSIDPSAVLLSMGYDTRMSRSSVRFSAGRETTEADYIKVIETLPAIVERIRGSSR